MTEQRSRIPADDPDIIRRLAAMDDTEWSALVSKARGNRPIASHVTTERT